MRKVIIHSHAFWPNVGGLENITGGLAKDWKERGIDLAVFTVTPDELNTDYGFPVIRELKRFTLFKMVKKADIFLEANISLKTFWIGLLFRNKWYVTHQGIYENNWKGRLKNFLTKYSNNIAASKYVATNIKGNSVVISNFYDHAFRIIAGIQRTNQLVFVGRMVSDKGADLLLAALKMLKDKGEIYSLTLIGDGPEMPHVLNLITQWGLKDQVTVKGILRGEELVQELNKHKVLVVPSRWDEPFGIVALEGMACGCRVVCSSGGGLPEAVGKLGITFKNNDEGELAICIEQAMDGYDKYNENIGEINYFLQSRTLKAISGAYLDVFTKQL